MKKYRVRVWRTPEVYNGVEAENEGEAEYRVLQNFYFGTDTATIDKIQAEEDGSI